MDERAQLDAAPGAAAIAMGPSVQNDPDCETLVELLRGRALRHPERPAFTFLAGDAAPHVSFSDLDRRARAIAARLQGFGLADARVLVLCSPGLDYIAALFGCFYARAVAIPAFPPRKNDASVRIDLIASDARAEAVLTTGDLAGTIEQHLSRRGIEGVRLVLVDGPNDDDDDASAAQWRDPAASAQTIALVQYTSGSTGDPKGVVVTHRNLLHNSEVIRQSTGLSSDTVGFSWLPPYHDMGLVGCIVQPVYTGFSAYLMSPAAFLQRPMRWLRAISRHRVTVSGGPDFAYDLLASRVRDEELGQLDLRSWEIAFTGAEPIRAATLARFADRFATCGFRREAFYPCYGIAEATLMCTGGRSRSLPTVRHLDAGRLERSEVVYRTEATTGTRTVVGCGVPAVAQKVVIVDPLRASPRAPGEVGEIWMSGASVAQGYWERPDATEETFRAFLADGDGPFLRTGDLGFVDGELFVTGRIKDVIIIRGRNHYPHDIEHTVECAHSTGKPGCAAAFSVEIDGDERLVVAVEVQQARARSLDLAALERSIREAVSREHQLQVWALPMVERGGIPRTSSGKLRRRDCRARFLDGTLPLLQSERAIGAHRDGRFGTGGSHAVS